MIGWRILGVLFVLLGCAASWVAYRASAPLEATIFLFGALAGLRTARGRELPRWASIALAVVSGELAAVHVLYIDQAASDFPVGSLVAGMMALSTFAAAVVLGRPFAGYDGATSPSRNDLGGSA